MRGTWQSESGGTGGVAALAAGIVAVVLVVAVVKFILSILWLLAAGVLVALALVAAGIVLTRRKYARAPQAAQDGRAALWPVSQGAREPLEAPRTVQALPPPQIHVHLDADAIAALLADRRQNG